MPLRDHMSTIGPCSVPTYPVDAWEAMPLTQKQLYDLWRIVGPNVAKHQERMPLWMVFVCVYLEGLLHGMQGMERLQTEVIDFQI